MSTSAAAWGDYDRDGDLDLVLCGQTSSYVPVTSIYRNDGGGVFTDIGAGLPGVFYGAVQWGDIDRDGDLDLVMMGSTNSATITRIYRNNGNGTFTDASAGLVQVSEGSLGFGDYDRDGDLDLAIVGVQSNGTFATRVYKNNGAGVFTDINAGIMDLGRGALDWADVDGDGDLDLAITGIPSNASFFGSVWRYMGNDVFVLAYPDEFVGKEGALTFGDWSNDGGQGLFVNGNNTSRIYWGTNGSFGESYYLEPVKYAGGAWGDYDNDQDLDLVQFGWPSLDGPGSTTLYRNFAVAAPNTPPSVPANLTASLDPSTNRLTISWSASTDAQTAANSITYNVRVGTSSGGNQIVSAMAAANGYRRLPEPGNAQTATSMTLTVPPGFHYFIAVQAIDGAFAGSAFSSQVEVDGTPPAPVTTLAASFGRSNAAVSWYASGDDGLVGNATLYEVRRSSIPIVEAAWAFAELVASGTPQPPGSLECVSVDVLTCSQHYFAVKTKDDSGNWSGISNAAGGSTACSGGSVAPCMIEARTPGPEVDPPVELPREIELSIASPLSERGVFRYGIPERMGGSRVEMAVFDVGGRKMATLLEGTATPGRAGVSWDLKLADGTTARSGVYFVRLQIGDRMLRRTVVISR